MRRADNPSYFRAMQKFYLILFFVAFSITTEAQTVISGSVLDEKKMPMTGANILLLNTYDGTTSDVNGKFSFKTEEKDSQTLQVQYIGYENYAKRIFLNGTPVTITIILKEKENELNVVTITAGSFEASDSKKVTILKPLDIVTTAGAAGDIQGALKTLPGTTNVGESEGLFVRGGTGAEAPQFIDGSLVRNPYYTAATDIAARGRFSPFLFKGTVFSTGGYSALYGQGMSSALILETQDMPDRTVTTMAISSVGIGAGHQHLSKKGNIAWGGDLNYTNLAPYFFLVKQKQDYSKLPEFFSGSLFYRMKTSKTGLLKFYGYANYNRLGFRQTQLDSSDLNYRSTFGLTNLNIYTNLFYKEALSQKLKLELSASYSRNHDDIEIGLDYNSNAKKLFDIHNQSNLAQTKAVFRYFFGKRSKLNFGGEWQNYYDTRQLNAIDPLKLKDNLSVLFAESDLYVSRKLVTRIGLRAEHSSLYNATDIAPRISVAYKLTESTDVSVAYGEFYQKPDVNILFYSAVPGFERASHYIFNIQRVSDNYTLRFEAYYKLYHDLVKTSYDYYTRRETYISNNGQGYARGIDIFWRDKKTLPGVDYWISYSYLDTKRDFKNYIAMVQPTFAAKHNASLVFKKFISPINTAFGFTYNYMSGRPYFNPLKVTEENFLSDRTMDYHNIGMNASYLTRIGKAFTVIVFSVNNVFGFDQVYGYRYSYDGQRSAAITPPAKRSFFVGIFMSIGQDKRKEAIDNNN
jgi:vitamin B12 transporter